MVGMHFFLGQGCCRTRDVFPSHVLVTVLHTINIDKIMTENTKNKIKNRWQKKKKKRERIVQLGGQTLHFDNVWSVLKGFFFFQTAWFRTLIKQKGLFQVFCKKLDNEGTSADSYLILFLAHYYPFLWSFLVAPKCLCIRLFSQPGSCFWPLWNHFIAGMMLCGGYLSRQRSNKNREYKLMPSISFWGLHDEKQECVWNFWYVDCAWNQNGSDLGSNQEARARPLNAFIKGCAQTDSNRNPSISHLRKEVPLL